MSYDVICLRPESDFLKVGVKPPSVLSVGYFSLQDTEVEAELKQAHALVIPAVGPKLDLNLFEESKLRFIQVTGAGVDRLDEEAMKQRDIVVANVAGGSNHAVAEYAVSAALMLRRQLIFAHKNIIKDNYANVRQQMVSQNLQGLEGLMVGVVGAGNIGSAVASAFHYLGCRIQYHDPVPVDAIALKKIDAASVSLDDLLSTSDIVTLHVPLESSTTNLIGADELARMKSDAILINTARGGIVDESALAMAISAGKLGGAVVDVFTSEPPDPDNPLLKLPVEVEDRLLLTPHIAGVTRQSWATLFRAAWENIERVIVRGDAPKFRVY